MSLQRSGLNPLAYLGVEPITPPNLIIQEVSPTIYDTNFHIGDFWVRGIVNAQGVYDHIIELWVLTILVGGIATWTQIYPGAIGASVFPCDVGVATQVGGILNIFGINHINTAGAGNTVTISIDGQIADTYNLDVGSATPAMNTLGVHGGAQIATAAIGAGHSIQISLKNGTNGQVLLGGGAAPLWATITSASITMTPGPNTLNMEVLSPHVATTYRTDAGDAHPLAGNLDYLGSLNINTAGAVHTITNNLDNDVVISGFWKAGTTVTAGTGLIVSSGGINSTGTTTLHSLGAGVMQTNAIGTVSSTKGTDGQILIAATGGAPAWANITSLGGTVTITNGSNSIDLSVPGSGGGGKVTSPAFQAIMLGYPINEPGLAFLTFSGVTYDTTGSFNGGIGTYTVPVTGKYYLEAWITNDPSSNGGFSVFKGIDIVTTTRIYTSQFKRAIAPLQTCDVVGMSICVSLTAGDTIRYKERNLGPIRGSSAYNGTPGTDTWYSWVSGYLI